MFATALSLAACLSLGASSANVHLATAESQVGDLRYAEAAKSLAKARSDPGNDRATLIRILELTGVVEGSLGHEKAAVDAFRTMLFIDPTRSLGDEWGPKVKTPFYEARGWMGDHHPLSAQDGGAKTEGGQVKAVTVVLGEDPLKLFATVRVHVVGATNAKPLSVPAAPGKVVVSIPAAPQIQWWAEVVGANDEVLGGVGDEMAPLKAGSMPASVAPPPVVTAAALPPPDTHATSNSAPAAAVSTSAPEPEAAYRPAAYGLMAGGVAALALGTIFGIQVHSEQSQLDSAAKDSQGRITGLTQAQAFALDSKARTNGVIADIGFAAGGLALAAGVGLWIYGGQVAAVPTTNGVAIAAAF